MKRSSSKTLLLDRAANLQRAVEDYTIGIVIAVMQERRAVTGDQMYGRQSVR
jgi:hypothetical protein